jgi:hypothetical protein
MTDGSIKRYGFFSFDQVIQSGKITALKLQEAIDRGDVRLRIDGLKAEWISGLELHHVLGIEL